MKDGRGGTLPIAPVPPGLLQENAVARDKHAERPGASVAPPSDGWDALYTEFLDAESRRAERAKRQAEEQEALKEFESWSSHTIDNLMTDVKSIAEGRSREFLERTGRTLEVQYPSGPAIAGPNGDPEIRFLRLSLGSARVHVYTSHARGGTTHVHLLPSRGDSLQKNHRLVSEPGAFIVRAADDTYELRFLRGDPGGKTGSPMSLDMLMFKAFRLLVRLAEDDLEEPPAKP
jgi:hypothetical protein